MQKWEYLVERLGSVDHSIQTRLNDLGDSGWELVTIRDGLYIFKRLMASWQTA